MGIRRLTLSADHVDIHAANKVHYWILLELFVRREAHDHPNLFCLVHFFGEYREDGACSMF